MHDCSMSRTCKAALSIFFLIFAFFSCAGRHTLILDVEDGLEAEASAWFEHNPLPHGYKAVTEGKGPVLRIRADRDFGNPDRIGESERVIAVKSLVPVVPLSDLRGDVSLEEAKLLPVMPLDEVRLPRMGVSVNGLYPEDVSYPLHELIILGFEGKPSAELSAWLESVPPPPAAERGVLIGAVGDIMPGRGVESLLLSGEKGLEAVFADTLPVLKGHDILIGNLEGPVSRGGEKRTKTYTFRFRPEVLAPLKKAGFTYLMTANNHCFDYGERAFLDTLLHLSEAGIGTSGAGKNLKEALMPWETEVRGLPVAILSLGAYPLERSGFNGRVEAAAADTKPGILWFGKEALSAVRDMKQKGAFAVVCVHGGVEYEHHPSAEQRELYQSLIDAGADIVFGSHPHVLQGMEPRGGGLIVYSLGNFVFPGMDGMERATETAVVSVRLYGGTIRYINFTPARISGTRTEIDSSGTVAKRYSGLTKLLSGD